MPAKKSPPYQYVSPENWAHPNAGKLDEIYRDSMRKGEQLPAEQGARPAPRQYAIPKGEREGRSGYGRPPIQYVEPTEQDLLNKRRTMVPRVPRTRTKDGIPWALPRTPRGLPGGMVIDLLDLADNMSRKAGGIQPDPANAPWMTLKCRAVPETDPANGYAAVSHDGYRSGHVNASDCGLQLQSWNGAGPLNQAQGTYSTSEENFTLVALAGKVNGPGGDPTGRPGNFSDRFMYSQVWWWHAPVGTMATYPSFVDAPASMSVNTMPDPNAQRRSSGERPNPYGPPPVGTAVQPAPAETVKRDMSLWPDFAPETWSFVVTPGRGGVKIPGKTPTINPDPLELSGDGPKRGQPPVRTVPGDPLHERKFVPRSKRLAALLFNALDNVSEGAEVIDAIYKALPKSVRKRWEEKHGREAAPFIDNAGQYGIDGADWKAKAIYYNMHKIDWDEAARNVIKNAVEDRILGDIHKRLPKNIGNTLSRDEIRPSNDYSEDIETDPMKTLSKAIDNWMDWLLDQAEKV